MNTGILKVLDVNGLSYLYTKLKNNIDDFQSASKATLDASANAANTAADRANAIISNANDTYATKDELATAINGVTSFEFSIVESLPSEGSKGVIYLIENTTGNLSGDQNVYDEYIWVGTKYEHIGTTDIDFSKYLTKDDAADTYLKKADAATDYAPKGDFETVKTKVEGIITNGATKLATARTITLAGSVTGSAMFDGSGDITINTQVQYGTEAPQTLPQGVLYCVVES